MKNGIRITGTRWREGEIVGWNYKGVRRNFLFNYFKQKFYRFNRFEMNRNFDIQNKEVY